MKLLDTNIVIYLQKGLLAEDLPADEYAVSVISEMELRSVSTLSPEEQKWLGEFIRDVNVIGISTTFKEKTISIRQGRKIKLPDAIIAATAIIHQAELLTNDKGLLGVAGLVAREVKIS